MVTPMSPWLPFGTHQGRAKKHGTTPMGVLRPRKSPT